MSLGTKEQRTEGMKKQAQELIDQAYQRGYKKAEEDYHIQTEKDRESSYQLGIEVGRKEAWEAAAKVWSYDHSERRKIFGVNIYSDGAVDIYKDFTATEAIEKLRTYEEQKKQEEEENKAIHVGDEVIYHDDKGVVVLVANNGKAISIMSANGGWMIRADSENLVKTGRTFPQIAEVLKKMREGE